MSKITVELSSAFDELEAAVSNVHSHCKKAGEHFNEAMHEDAIMLVHKVAEIGHVCLRRAYLALGLSLSDAQDHAQANGVPIGTEIPEAPTPGTEAALLAGNPEIPSLVDEGHIKVFGDPAEIKPVVDEALSQTPGTPTPVPAAQTLNEIYAEERARVAEVMGVPVEQVHAISVAPSAEQASTVSASPAPLTPCATHPDAAIRVMSDGSAECAGCVPVKHYEDAEGNVVAMPAPAAEEKHEELASGGSVAPEQALVGETPSQTVVSPSAMAAIQSEVEGHGGEGSPSAADLDAVAKDPAEHVEPIVDLS